MKTIATTLYEYHELDDSAKDKARHWWLSCDSFDPDHELEHIKEALEALGFSCDGQKWQFNWEVGGGNDGFGFASWYSYEPGCVAKADQYGDVPGDCARRLTALQRPHFYKLTARTTLNRGIYSPGCSASVDSDHHEPTDADETEFDSIVSELCHWAKKQLQDEYEYVQSEECIADAMEANGYTFLKDGTRFG